MQRGSTSEGRVSCVTRKMMTTEGERIRATKEQIEALSRENPMRVYDDENGRIAWNGMIFDSEGHFRMHMRMAGVIIRFKQRVRNIFRWKK